MGLFKKKPGGTFFGNLLRAGSSKLAPGVLGTGANRIEMGQTLTNAQLANGQGNTYNVDTSGLINDIFPRDNTKTLYWVVGGLTAVIIGFIAYTQGLFTKGYKKGKR